jgi:hypothetical protein
VKWKVSQVLAKLESSNLCSGALKIVIGQDVCGIWTPRDIKTPAAKTPAASEPPVFPGWCLGCRCLPTDAICVRMEPLGKPDPWFWTLPGTYLWISRSDGQVQRKIQRKGFLLSPSCRLIGPSSPHEEPGSYQAQPYGAHCAQAACYTELSC